MENGREQQLVRSAVKQYPGRRPSNCYSYAYRGSIARDRESLLQDDLFDRLLVHDITNNCGNTTRKTINANITSAKRSTKASSVASSKKFRSHSSARPQRQQQRQRQRQRRVIAEKENDIFDNGGDVLFDVSRLDSDDATRNPYHVDNVLRDITTNANTEKRLLNRLKKREMRKRVPASPSARCQTDREQSDIVPTKMEISPPSFCHSIRSSSPIGVGRGRGRGRGRGECSSVTVSNGDRRSNEPKRDDDVESVNEFTNTSTIDNSIHVSPPPQPPPPLPPPSSSMCTWANRCDCDSYELTQLSQTCSTTNSSFTVTCASPCRIGRSKLQHERRCQRKRDSSAKLAESSSSNDSRENCSATMITAATIMTPKNSCMAASTYGNNDESGHFSRCDCGNFSHFEPATVSTPESYLPHQFDDGVKKPPSSLSVAVAVPAPADSKCFTIDRNIVNTENMDDSRTKLDTNTSKDGTLQRDNCDVKSLSSSPTCVNNKCSANETSAELSSSSSSTSNDASAAFNRFETLRCSTDGKSKLRSNHNDDDTSNKCGGQRTENDDDDGDDDDSWSQLFASLSQSRVLPATRSPLMVSASSSTHSPQIDRRSHCGLEPANLPPDPLCGYENFVDECQTQNCTAVVGERTDSFETAFEPDDTKNDRQSSTSADEKRTLKDTIATSTSDIIATTSTAAAAAAAAAAATTVPESFRLNTNFTERKKTRKEKNALAVALPTLFENERDEETMKSAKNERLVGSPSPSPSIDGSNRSCNHDCSQYCANCSRVETTFSRRRRLYLNGGKKWRRSYITLKNIHENGAAAAAAAGAGGGVDNFNATSFVWLNRKNDDKRDRDDNLKIDSYARTSYVGRCWRKNVEDLIEKQPMPTLFRVDPSTSVKDGSTADGLVDVDGAEYWRTTSASAISHNTRYEQQQHSTMSFTDTVLPVRRATIRFSTRIVSSPSIFNHKTSRPIIAATASDCDVASFFSSWSTSLNDHQTSYVDGSTAIVAASTLPHTTRTRHDHTRTTDATITAAAAAAAAAAATATASDCGATKTTRNDDRTSSYHHHYHYNKYNESCCVENIRPPSPAPEPPPRFDFNATMTRSARQIVLRYCNQIEPLPFEACFTQRVLKKCKKIGEGVYGEVFALNQKTRPTVLKIMPIEGDKWVNGEKQKTYEEILSELVIAVELANLKRRKDYSTNNFAQVRRCCVVYGTYPQRLVDLWQIYDREKGSDNESPIMFEHDQLYMVIEFDHGGQDLESFKFNNARQALSVFKQIAHALAVAEQALMFEHRDLHWGNVLVVKTLKRNGHFVTNGRSYKFGLCGVKATIIDYTLSRISINNRTLYNDIGRDCELFEAEGDFQFEVYRLMRQQVGNVWHRFAPKTNILWLAYLLDKIMHQVHFANDQSRSHRVNMDNLRSLYDYPLTKFHSCVHLVESGLVD